MDSRDDEDYRSDDNSNAKGFHNNNHNGYDSNT